MNGSPHANNPVTNIGIGLVTAIACVAIVLRAAASLAALASGVPQPTGGLGSGLDVLADPGNPGPRLGAPRLHPVLYWTTVGLLATGLGALAWTGRHLVTSQRRDTPTDPRMLPGTARRREIAATASSKTLLRRAETLRPSLHKAHPRDVGYLLGHGRGHAVWATVEDAILVIGPPRSGKGLHLVINAILDAPGAVVTTSTRPDNLAVTMAARRQEGPVAVFDPQKLAPGVPSGLRWSPVRGCHDPLTAMIRATGLAASTGLGSGGVDNGSFWEGKTRAAIQCLLHAAALDGRTAADLYRWALSPAAATDAVRILQSHRQAADGWAEALDGMVSADPRARDSIWHGVGLAFSALADPRVLDTVTPHAGDSFDPETFLQERGTLYLLATGAGAGASAPLVAALIEDLVEVARRIAARSPGARLDPPLLLALDEIGNLAPLPSLPTLMAEGGGTGITTMPVLQSVAQAREKWGEHQAAAVWDASIVKIVLGGESNAKDLQDLSALIGERDEDTTSTSYDHHGARSYQKAIRRVPVMPPDTLRTMPFGTGVVLLRAARPIITTLRPWTKRRDASTLRLARTHLEDQVRHAYQLQGNGRVPPA